MSRTEHHCIVEKRNQFKYIYIHCIRHPSHSTTTHKPSKPSQIGQQADLAETKNIEIEHLIWTRVGQ